MKEIIIIIVILIIIFCSAYYVQNFLNNTSDTLVSKLEDLKKDIEEGSIGESELKQKSDEIYSDLYVIVDEYEMRHFNRTIYEEKVSELQLLIKKDKVNKKMQDIEGDFEE